MSEAPKRRLLACADCALWEARYPIFRASPRKRVGTLGLCRAKPPALGEGGKTGWPQTQNTDGCGEGEPK